MKNQWFRLFVLLITTALSLIVSYLAGLVIDMDIFSGAIKGFELLILGVTLPVLYAVARFFSRTVIVIVSIVLGAAVAFILMQVMGNALPLYVTFIGLFLASGLILDIFWMRPNAMRLKSIPFALMGAVAYALFVIVAFATKGNMPAPGEILEEFEFGLFIYLALSLAITVSEKIYFPLGMKWEIEGFFYTDDDKEESESKGKEE